ncbi:hypothetical protein GGX14DRAFT_644100 [Mycena pura]|uniref:Glucose-methanol-choline oxidoreductase C-terminal domain-containing protein n=1 Tax=Mycena pura TaxID=153505 RepID=A0AAD6YCR8_9AGAR|nr:hypothetical protein GGX14DRAFT_644100 [Mycena pura]
MPPFNATSGLPGPRSRTCIRERGRPIYSPFDENTLGLSRNARLDPSYLLPEPPANTAGLPREYVRKAPNMFSSSNREHVGMFGSASGFLAYLVSRDARASAHHEHGPIQCPCIRLRLPDPVCVPPPVVPWRHPLHPHFNRPTTASVTETAPVPLGCAAYPAAIACTPRAQTCTNAPASDSGFLAQRMDITALRWVYKQSRKYARRLPLYHGASRPFFPRFPEGGPTAAVLHGNRREWARERTDTFGTCTMRLLMEGGVVDSMLNVYGVHCLKVINMSIAPSNVCVYTNYIYCTNEILFYPFPCRVRLNLRHTASAMVCLMHSVFPRSLRQTTRAQLRVYLHAIPAWIVPAGAARAARLPPTPNTTSLLALLRRWLGIGTGSPYPRRYTGFTRAGTGTGSVGYTRVTRGLPAGKPIPVPAGTGAQPPRIYREAQRLAIGAHLLKAFKVHATQVGATTGIYQGTSIMLLGTQLELKSNTGLSFAEVWIGEELKQASVAFGTPIIDGSRRGSVGWNSGTPKRQRCHHSFRSNDTHNCWEFVRATLDVSHKAAGQRGILRASYDKTEGIYSPGQRGILGERGAYPRESGSGVQGMRGREASEAEAQGVRDPEVKPQRPKGRPELRRIRVKANDSGNTA